MIPNTEIPGPDEPVSRTYLGVGEVESQLGSVFHLLQGFAVEHALFETRNCIDWFTRSIILENDWERPMVKTGGQREIRRYSQRGALFVWCGIFSNALK